MQIKGLMKEVAVSSSLLPIGILFAFFSSVIIYKVTVSVSPEARMIAPIYFGLVLLVSVVLETLLVMLATRFAKIENRTWQKAFFVATGSNLINSLFSIASAPFSQTHKIWAAIFSIVAGFATWFFVKRVYSLTHKKLFRLVAFTVLIVFVFAIVAGFLGSALLPSH